MIFGANFDIGKPSEEDLDSLDSEVARKILKSIDCTKRKSFTRMFSSASADAQDLLRKLLIFNPLKRITVEEALEHPFVADFHYPEEEKKCKRAVHIPINDNIKLSRHDYREAL